MFVVKRRKNDASKKVTGYVSSSIFKPTDSESEVDARAINYQPMQQYYNGTLTPQRPRYKQQHNTQKIIKLKQLRMKQQQDQNAVAYEHGGFMYQRRKPSQPALLSRNSYLAKQSHVGGMTSLPRIPVMDSMTTTPRDQRVFKPQTVNRLSPGQLNSSPPLSNIEGYADKKRGGTPNGVVRHHSRPPSWNARTQHQTSIQQQAESHLQKSLPKSFNSLPILPVYQSQATNVDTPGTQSDMMAGNASPLLQNIKNQSRSSMKLKELTGDQRVFQQSQKKLIDQSTLPNSNLSESEINRINDLHAQVLNQQLNQQLQFNSQMTEGIGSRDTHASTVNLNKPPLILNNQLAMKKQRRRQIQVQESGVGRHSMNQQPYGQPAYYLPNQNKIMRSAPRLYDSPVNAIEDDQPLSTVPYAIVPMEQPIMMVNQSSRASPIYLQPPGYPSLQPMHYGGYSDMIEMTPDGSQQFLMNTTDSGSENMYYQMVPPSDLRDKSQRPIYNKSPNALENWSQLTQGLMDLQKYRIIQQIQASRENPYAQGVEFDTEEVLEQESELYPQQINQRSNLRAPRQSVPSQAKQRWMRATKKIQNQGYRLEGQEQSMKKRTVSRSKGNTKAIQSWMRVLLKLQDQTDGFKEPIKSSSKPATRQKKSPQKRKEIYRRWNKVIRKVLHKIESQKAQDNLVRWTKLLKNAEKAGHIQLKGLESKNEKALREKKEHSLKVIARWLRFTKKLQRNQKLDRLDILGQWKRLIDGITKLHSTAPKDKSLRISAKWRKLAVMMLKKDEKESSLNVIGKWRILVQSYMDSEQANKKLKLNAKWRLLSIKLIQRAKKEKHLRAVGSWRKIYNSLKKYEFAIHNERKIKRMQIYGIWSKMARKLLQNQNRQASLQNIGRWKVLIRGVQNQRKIKSLQIIGKWGILLRGLKNLKAQEQKQKRTKQMILCTKWKYCARQLLQRHYKMQSFIYRSKWQQFATKLLDKNKNQQSFRILKRWQNLIKTLANVEENDLKLTSIKFMKVSEQIDRLEQHQEKVEKMEVYGKWNRMAWTLLSKQNKIQARQDKIQRMVIIGKWNIMTRRLADKQHVENKWADLITKLYSQNGSAFGLNLNVAFKAETLLQRLQARQDQKSGQLQKMSGQQEKQVNPKKIEIRERWALLVGQIVKKKMQRELIAAINLRRLAVKLLKKEYKRQTIQKWQLVAKRVLKIIQDEKLKKEQAKKPTNMEIVGKWAKISQKLIKKNDGRTQMLASINLTRLARKLLKRQQLALQKYRAEQRESRVQSQNRQEKAHRRLRNLTTKLLVYDSKQRSRRAQFNLAKLSNLLLRQDKEEYINRIKQTYSHGRNMYASPEVQPPTQPGDPAAGTEEKPVTSAAENADGANGTQPDLKQESNRLNQQDRARKRSTRDRRAAQNPRKVDQWRKMYMQLHQQKTAVVIKRHEKRLHKRTSHLDATDKWELLTAYIVTKKQQDKSMNNILKWKHLVSKLYSQQGSYPSVGNGRK